MNYLLSGEESNRLFYRKIQASDYNDWLPFFEDEATSRHWIAERELPQAECKKWYEKQLWRYANKKGGMNAVIEKSSNKLIGHCGLLIQTVDDITELEIAYSLLPQFWGNGYATEAAVTCKKFAFKNNLSTSLISIISLGNKPSQKVALKNGMQIDKTTVYNKNEVFIFRINKALS